MGELAAGKTAVDAALFEGKQPVLSEESSTSKENIGLTSAATSKKARSNLIDQADDGLTLNYDAAANTLTLAAKLGERANNDIKGTVITQARDKDGNWTCTVDGKAAKGFKPKFVPTGCTNT